METIKKAVIPTAGLGTRFLPATKTVPKELLPIVDRPALLYIVEEAVNSGIEDIVLITGRGKEAIESFFDVSYELEDTLHKAGKSHLLDKINSIKDMANIISIRQKQALGLGHAVLCSQPIVGDEPFAVMLGDEVMITAHNQPPVLKQLTQQAEASGLSTVAVMPVAAEDVNKYGIIETEEHGSGHFKVLSVIEKPSTEEAPSQLALPGRYVFDPKIYSYLKNTDPGKNGEIQLTDAMCDLAKDPGLIATQFFGHRYDTGDKLGFLQANVELAAEHEEIGPAFKEFLKTFVKERLS